MSRADHHQESQLPAKALAARRWAQRVVAAGEALVLDLETTGLGPLDEPIEIAILGLAGDCRLQELLRPSRPITEEAGRVHGLGERELATAARFATIAGRVRSVLVGRTVLSYNAAFDRSMLWRAFERSGQPSPRCRWQCVCDRFEAWAGFRATLGQAAETLGVEVRDRHRALVDAETARLVVITMAGVSGRRGRASGRVEDSLRD